MLVSFWFFSFFPLSSRAQALFIPLYGVTSPFPVKNIQQEKGVSCLTKTSKSYGCTNSSPTMLLKPVQTLVGLLINKLQQLIIRINITRATKTKKLLNNTL